MTQPLSLELSEVEHQYLFQVLHGSTTKARIQLPRAIFSHLMLDYVRLLGLAEKAGLAARPTDTAPLATPPEKAPPGRDEPVDPYRGMAFIDILTEAKLRGYVEANPNANNGSRAMAARNYLKRVAKGDPQ